VGTLPTPFSAPVGGSSRPDSNVGVVAFACTLAAGTVEGRTVEGGTVEGGTVEGGTVDAREKVEGGAELGCGDGGGNGAGADAGGFGHGETPAGWNELSKARICKKQRYKPLLHHSRASTGPRWNFASMRR